MNGANEFYTLIKNAQYKGVGNLKETKLGYKNHGGDAVCYREGDALYVTSSHARGNTFYIYLIDEKDELFKVYGITGGNPGWTETYGWLHKGTWVKQIFLYFKELERKLNEYDETILRKKREKEREQNKTIEEKINKFNAIFK